ncbi:MAG: nucleotidyltransferase family protein [Lachnospiraceae bacterium]|nr:nucleotidyltransferase family protein [Lachnospiraceae bacterium]
MDNGNLKINKIIYALLSESLNPKGASLAALTEDMTAEEWLELYRVAERHAIEALIYERIENSNAPEHIKTKFLGRTRIKILQSYKLWFLTKYIAGLMEKAGIDIVVLKGIATAGYYAVPELRKSGDVDILLLDSGKLPEAKRLLLDNGFRISDEQHAVHHLAFVSEDKIYVEVHTLLAEPFDNNRINDYLERMLKDVKLQKERGEVIGIAVPRLKPGFHAYELLMHMLQHYLLSGFGLRLMADWVVFWNSDIPEEERQIFLKLVRESRVKGFCDTITKACIRYLGLEGDKVSFMELESELDIDGFMEEMMVSGDFGEDDKTRMLVLRDKGIKSYLIAFHHQMKRNHPEKSRYVILWPALWIITFVVFIRNNRKLRHVSTLEVLKKSGQRAQYIKNMHIWKK